MTMRTMLILTGLVVFALAQALPAEAGGKRSRGRKSPSVTQSARASGGDTSNTNVAVPPAIPKMGLGEVSLICERARINKKQNEDDQLCELGMIEVHTRSCAASPICVGPPFWFARWPFIGPYCC